MELSIRVMREGALMTREAAQIAERMKLYSASVLLQREDMTVNAKSLMGIVTLGVREGMTLTIIAAGEDEAKAVCELAALLGA